jgi:hypothetical protein
MKTVAIFFCMCLIAAEGCAKKKQVAQFPDTNLERVVSQETTGVLTNLA